MEVGKALRLIALTQENDMWFAYFGVGFVNCLGEEVAIV